MREWTGGDGNSDHTGRRGGEGPAVQELGVSVQRNRQGDTGNESRNDL